jgi:hypothetical protein
MWGTQAGGGTLKIYEFTVVIERDEDGRYVGDRMVSHGQS